MPTQDFILAPSTVRVRLSLEPVYNALNSIILLNIHESRSGLSEWVTRTVAALSPEARFHNRVVGVIMSALEPDAHFLDFAEYINYLSNLDPNLISQRYFERASHWGEVPENIAHDQEVYINFLQNLYDKKSEEFKRDFFAQVFDLLQRPQELKALVVNHLRYMWDHWLAPEWKHVLPMLEESLLAFRQLDFNDLTVLEAARAVTGRDLSSHWEDSDSVEEAIFVPSAHIGPYVTRFDHDKTIYVLFGARVPEGVRTFSQALNRSDLLVQLSALADDTRLSILQLLTQHEELCAQDIITMLELSQSSASRHLRQLTASGYLIERRRDVAKCYSLNQGRVQETALALRLFLSRK